MKEGDIFRWRYKPEREAAIRKWTCDPYWAKSCIAVVRNGALEDTFWHGSGNSIWTQEEAERELELTYLGNFADLEKAHESEAGYYDDSDCANLNHSNSTRGNFYLRKGARRSKQKMLETAARKLERAEQESKSAQRYAERLRETIEAIERGELEGVYL